jgi:glycerol uptake facilitator protein
MTAFWSEFVGTALMILFGGGVVANVVLEKSKGQQGGWIVITLGWAMAVFLGVYSSVHLGGQGHLNPAVSMALAHMGKLDLSLLPVYVAAQFAGSFTGAIMVWIVYQKHFDATTNADLKMAIFCTAPAIENKTNNLLTEIIGTFVLVFGALCLSPAAATLGSLDALPVSLLVLGIGLSLGGPTGYAINPARDLAPRIAHFLLPIPGKRDSGWGYSWIPIIGPIIGAHLAALIYVLLTK